MSPANYPESLSVGAVSGADLVQSSSSRGPSSCGGRTRVFPDVVAPGVDVYTADRYGLYQYASGTSVAAPHVAGALALLLGARPDLDVDADQQAVEGTARDLGIAGPDEAYGNGLVDVAAAYASLPPPAPPQPDFAVSLSPAAVTVRAGDATAFTVQVTPADGFTDEVALSLSGLDPEGVSRTFAPQVLPGGGSSTLTVGTTSATPAGSYPFSVTATDGTRTRTADGVLTVTAPPPPPLFFSTAGNTNPPGVAGTADDADIYGWNGQALQPGRATRPRPVCPAAANVDGYDRVSATHFYVSFVDNVTIARPGPDLVGPGRGRRLLRRRHVVGVLRRHRARADGREPGPRRDQCGGLDGVLLHGRQHHATAVWVVPRTTRTSTAGTARRTPGSGTRVPTGWPGRRTSTGSSGSTPTHFYLSFAADTTLPGLGAVQDEDVVFDDNGAWSVYFDGTAHGLTSNNLDVDALSLG